MGVEAIKPVAQMNVGQLTEHEGANLHTKHQAEHEENLKTSKPALEHQEVVKHVKLANEFLKTMDTRLEYQYNEEINRDIVKVVNQDNGEVVRQLPADEIVKMLTKMHELLGVIFDRKF